MSDFFNFFVSSALGVTTEELSAAQKATDLKKKKKRKDSASASAASSSSQTESSTSSSNTNTVRNETSEERSSNKETREAESDAVTQRPVSTREEGEGELPTYSAATGDPPAYSRESR
ncbi:hypothetical protein IFR04_007142 [Cadophora malorum]|uniref:Uncharacterized protein n=1 Tax=Cadophora malorum TaxID=108018 RepID=A0A8H7TIE7_9HELO|nr:hypothetical protein IFR04_007142 [Cadophora malorum]